jgi:prolyl 4-hydroxylase
VSAGQAIDLAALRAAAERGSIEHAHALAQALVAQERLDEALQWHLRAAQGGHAGAQVEYARMRLYGIVGAPAPQEALAWFERAERAGHPLASEYLVKLAVGGVALPRDARMNERLLRGVQADHAPSLLAAAVHFGRKPHPDDQTLCLQLLERAAARGDIVAAVLLAERLAHGEGCEAQPEAAQDLWTQLDAAGVERLPDFTLPPSGAADAPPRQLAIEEAMQAPAARVLATQPRVSVIDRLLSADECRLLIVSARPHLHASRTLDPTSGQALNVDLRTSHDAQFDPLLESLAVRLVQWRMAAAAGLELVEAEPLIVLRYAPGQEYKPHRDYLPPASIARDGPQAGNRRRTICVYLNPVEAGGATAFPAAGLQVAPLPGRAVVFDNMTYDDASPQGRPDPDSLHAGMPVEAGEKWLATLWIRQGRYRAF